MKAAVKMLAAGKGMAVVEVDGGWALRSAEDSIVIRLKRGTFHYNMVLDGFSIRRRQGPEEVIRYLEAEIDHASRQFESPVMKARGMDSFEMRVREYSQPNTPRSGYAGRFALMDNYPAGSGTKEKPQPVVNELGEEKL